MSDKILFVMFQGRNTTLRSWNENTKSRFLARLKQVGNVYAYQDRLYNLSSSTRNFTLADIMPDSYISNIYTDIKKKYDLTKYKLIPIGWSAGGLFALYFAQVYHANCSRIILLDPVLWTKSNMPRLLARLKHDTVKLTPNVLKQLLLSKSYNIIKDSGNYMRALFFGKRLNVKLPVNTIAFVNFEKPEHEKHILSDYFTNKRKSIEIDVLTKANPNYQAIILKNKTHCVFDMVLPAKLIIDHIIQEFKKI